MERTWTEIAEPYTSGERRGDIEAALRSLRWHRVPNDEPLSAPMAPGLAIKNYIRELRLPKVSKVAWNGAVEWPGATPELDGEYYGVYGIEANYGNGRALIFVLDRGTELVTLCSDFEPKH